jgi:hypothetical protein
MIFPAAKYPQKASNFDPFFAEFSMA